MRPTVSVVAPVHNEEDSVVPFVEELFGVLEASGRGYEIICVDDGSTDRTAERLRDVASRFAQVRPLALDAHRGQSAALWAGIGVAAGDLIALMDADLQNDPRDIPGMLAELEDSPRCDCVLGVRARRHDAWGRRVSSRLANRVGGIITGMRFGDAGCALKLCRAPTLKSLPFFRGAHRFVGTLVAMRGGVVVEKQVNHRPRTFGFSKYGSGLGRTVTVLRDAFGVRWLADRHIRSDFRPIV